MPRVARSERAGAATVAGAERVGRADLLEVSLRRPGTRRVVEPSLVILGPVAPNVNVSVDLFAGSDNYRELSRLDGRVRAHLARTALPLSLPLKSGAYLVPRELRGEIETWLNAKLQKRDALRDAFLSEYAALRSKAGRGVPFPERVELASAFQAEVRFSRWDDFVSRLWHEAGREVNRYLRQQFLDLMESFAHNLEWTDDGRKRPVTRVTVERIREFIETFASRNLVDDSDLQALVEQARETFSVDGDLDPFIRRVRGNDEARRSVHAEVEGLVRSIRLTKPPGDDAAGPVH